MEIIMKIISSILSKRWQIFGLTLCVLLLSGNYISKDGDGLVPSKTRNMPDNMYGIGANSGSDLVAVGYHSAVFHSNNNGNSWRRIKVDSNELLRRVAVNEDGVAVAVGHKGGIYKIYPKTGTYKKIYQVDTGYLRDVYSYGGNNLVVVGKNGGIYISHDYGETWGKKDIVGYPGRDIPTLNGVSKLGTGFIAVGEFGALIYSEDGEDWISINSDDENTFTAVKGCDGCSFAIAVGLDGIIRQIILNDGNVVVKKISKFSDQHLFDVDFDGKDVIVVGDSIILRLSNKNKKYLVYEDKNFDSRYSWLYGVQVFNGNIFAVGRAGSMLAGKSSNFPNSYNNFKDIN